jgi:hypothetical protein
VLRTGVTTHQLDRTDADRDTVLRAAFADVRGEEA